MRLFTLRAGMFLMVSICALPFGLCFLNRAAAQQPAAGFDELKSQAEQLIEQRSYARAHELYQHAASIELPAPEKRWVDFRLADTSWRGQAATQTSDSTIYDRARQQLEGLINAIQRAEDRDRVWAEAQESLGDFFWQRNDVRDWGNAWQHYQAALDWWSGSSDMDGARARYLRIVWAAAEPTWAQRDSYGYYNYIPIDVLDNALKIAVDPNDQSHARFLIAMMLRNQGGDMRQQLRILREFEGAIVAGKAAQWYDDALFAYGEWLMNNGRPIMHESGQWTREPDYPSAVALFKRLLRDFRKGESRYWDNAQQQIKNITQPSVSVGVSNIFLPGSEIQFALNWRNVKEINLSLHRIDLTNDVSLTTDGRNDPAPDWMNRIKLGEPIKTWTKDGQDQGDYKPHQAFEKLDAPLAPGAYVVQASAENNKTRDLILVTDASVILKTTDKQAVAYVCNVLDSSPLPNANVHIWRFDWDGDQWIVTEARKTTDENGLAAFDDNAFAKSRHGNTHYFATANLDNRQAFAASQGYWYNRNDQPWRIYAFTDRPAYRPGETVQWKLIARQSSPNGFATPPTDQHLYYQVNDPRGSKITEGDSTLNAFGSAWGSFELNSTMPLGEYIVYFYKDQAHQSGIGQATLFRMEEYKLPEFQVTISTPEENGRKKAYILGDYVEATIQADYYFGGPVANANVEVVVTQNPYYRWWMPTRDYPWLYEDNNPYRYWGGGGQIIKRETIKTDQTGKAVLTFETPLDAQQEFEYRIEARVTDSSRREITANDSVRVTKQRYYVRAEPKHYLHRPGDKVEITFKAQDANDQPVQVEGAVKVTREMWREIWIDPAGLEITGDQLRKIQEGMNGKIFPPPPAPDQRPWQLKFRGYEAEDVLSTRVKLNEKGEGEFAFTPQKEGYYKVYWRSDDPQAGENPVAAALPITTETAVWVATNASTELGYRHGGLEIIIDKDTTRIGQTAPVMIVTPTNDRHVLFSIEGDDLYSYQVVHVTGTVKLVQVPIGQQHVPNVYFHAVMPHNAQIFEDRKEVVVPPLEQYLKVDVKSDRAQYQPGEEGKFTITTTDHDGKPVSAEVALAVFDDSVSYIAQDYAGDPRQFFFDRRQNLLVQTGSTFQQKPYVRLLKWQNDQLIDEKQRALLERDDKEMLSKDESYQLGDYRHLAKARNAGVFGGRGGGLDGLADAAAPAGAEPTGNFESMARSETKLGMPMKAMKQAAAQAPAPGGKPAEGGQPEMPPNVVVRSDFRSTLLWQPSVITDEDGAAKLTLKYADSLTTWKATARAAGKGNEFGIGSTKTRTKMPLIARLQAPRFFLVGDTVTISGVINNNTDEVQNVTPQLDAKGLTIIAMLKDSQPVKGIGTVDIAANSEARVDWQVSVESAAAGDATLKLTAKSKKYADAMEKTYPIYEHGVERFIAKSGKVRGNDVTIKLDIPSERKVESTALMVQITPSMAVTMLDALPYLIDYPYGCTEQTMSRFLPAVITAKTLRDLGLKPEDAMAKVFGGIEQEHADKTHPKGKKDLKKLDEMTQAGLNRLYDFQHGDGGWAWWKEGDSDHFMTAYVLWGLCLAKDAGLDVKQDVIDRAANYLNLEIVKEESNYDMQAWVLHALASYHATKRANEAPEFQKTALNNLWNNREKLNAYTRALLALSAHNFGDAEKAKILVDNLFNGVKRDDRPDTSVIVKGMQGPNEAVIGTAHWGQDGAGGWWRWSDGGIEATAFALKAILAIDPKNKLVEPVTNWLIKNRRGAQWSNTRDTAIVVLAMNDYLRASGELTPELEYELSVNGKSIASKKLSAADVLAAPSRFEIDRNLIRDGGNEIRIVRKNGSGPIYFAAEAKFFSLEDPVPPAGNEIFVRREYYKLAPRPTLLKGYVYDRVPMGDGDTVKSGERIEVVMTVEAKNNYEYLVFEDLKPAGLEAVAIRSGESMYAKQMKQSGVEHTFGAGERGAEKVRAEQAQSDAADFTGRTAWIYPEWRDRNVALFISNLPEGVWEIRYDLRAETPGRFHALPVLGHAMYVPEIRANSGEIRLSVIE